MSETAPASRPKRLRRTKAVDYLEKEHGIRLEEKTLANRNAAGLGPRPEYLGTIPYYSTTTLDNWAADAFTSESPVAVTRRKARTANRDPQRADERLPAARDLARREVDPEYRQKERSNVRKNLRTKDE
jgi:hypothetical protein